MIKELSENLGVIMQILTLGGIIFAIYKSYSNPQVKLDKDYATMEIECKYKHHALDENIHSINRTLTLIQENHLSHIENEIKRLGEGQIRLETIINERLK
jgi:hypothetical protein